MPEMPAWDDPAYAWDDGTTLWDGGMVKRWTEQPAAGGAWVAQTAPAGIWTEQPDAE